MFRSSLSLSLFIFVWTLAPALQITGQELGNTDFVGLSGSPRDVVIDEARGLAYVSNETLNQIDVIDLNTLTTGTPISITTGSGPRGLEISPDGNTLLTTLAGSAQMGVIDLATHSQVQTITLPDLSGNQNQRPSRVDYDSNGTLFFSYNTPNNPHGKVYTLDLDTGISTQQFASNTWVRYEASPNGDTFNFHIDDRNMASWDAGTQSYGPIVSLNDSTLFGGGNGVGSRKASRLMMAAKSSLHALAKKFVH